ncbi:MAG: anaerobic ribonucleoside-triphosphate reductase activating protein [Firmicutes bacterium]|nr:anaerobic ribonucleoside-triphosphate reductase activating protein [Bacillota bacterium]
MRIAGVQKMTLLDYPGHIAATIFTPGCDMRCPFCHNSELVLDNSDLEYYPDEVLGFLKTRQGKLGGIAITGGEPLMQSDIDEFIIKVRDLGFKVKLDTNGTYPEKLRDLLDRNLVDYVAMDIKNSPEKWAMTTGLSGDGARILFGKTLRSMSIIKLSGVDYEFRTTIVKGLHELSDMDSLGQLVRGAKRYFLQNFTDSGAILDGTWGAWDKETLLAMLNIIRKYVPGAELRGVD